MSTSVRQVWQSQSIPAMSTVNGPLINVEHVTRLRPVIVESGQNCTVRLQGSIDNAASWLNFATYQAGSEGIKDLVVLLDPLMRLSVTNAAGTPQTISAYVLLEV